MRSTTAPAVPGAAPARPISCGKQPSAPPAVPRLGAAPHRVGVGHRPLHRLRRPAPRGHPSPCLAPPHHREIVRYEHARPGALVHLDIKKLGRIPQGGGKRILPGFAETRSGPRHSPRLGFDFLHVAVDDHSRSAYVAALADERGATAAGFLQRVLAHFKRHGIAVERILTDNGACYVSRTFASTAAARGVRLKRTRALPASDQRQGGGVHQDPPDRVGLPAAVSLQPRATRRVARVPCVLQSAPSPRRHRRRHSRLPAVNNVLGNYT